MIMKLQEKFDSHYCMNKYVAITNNLIYVRITIRIITCYTNHHRPGIYDIWWLNISAVSMTTKDNSWTLKKCIHLHFDIIKTIHNKRHEFLTKFLINSFLYCVIVYFYSVTRFIALWCHYSIQGFNQLSARMIDINIFKDIHYCSRIEVFRYIYLAHLL